MKSGPFQKSEKLDRQVLLVIALRRDSNASEFSTNCGMNIEVLRRRMWFGAV